MSCNEVRQSFAESEHLGHRNCIANIIHRIVRFDPSLNLYTDECSRLLMQGNDVQLASWATIITLEDVISCTRQQCCSQLFPDSPLLDSSVTPFHYDPANKRNVYTLRLCTRIKGRSLQASVLLSVRDTMIRLSLLDDQFRHLSRLTNLGPDIVEFCSSYPTTADDIHLHHSGRMDWEYSLNTDTV